jgi:hypothetical protein
LLRATVLLSGSNLFGECEQEEASSFFINSQKAFRDFPSEVISIALRNFEIELLPAIEQTQNEKISFEVSTSGKIIPDRSSLDDWQCFSFLDHTASLPHACDSYLGWQFKSFPDCLVDGIVKLEVLSNLMLPSVINAELQGFGISLDSSDKFLGWINSDFCSGSCSHSGYKEGQVFKTIGGKFAFLPTLKGLGIQANTIL